MKQSYLSGRQERKIRNRSGFARDAHKDHIMEEKSKLTREVVPEYILLNLSNAPVKQLVGKFPAQILPRTDLRMLLHWTYPGGARQLELRKIGWKPKCWVSVDPRFTVKSATLISRKKYLSLLPYAKI